MSFVVSMNLHRRQLTYDQRVGVALKLEPAFAEEARERMLAGTNPGPNTAQGRAAEQAARQAKERQRGGQGGVLLVPNTVQAKSVHRGFAPRARGVHVRRNICQFVDRCLPHGRGCDGGRHLYRVRYK